MIDVSEFVMKKTSFLKFDDMIQFVITIIGVVVAVAAPAGSTIHLISFYLLHFVLL